MWCWDGTAQPRCMTAQPGGMSADILQAHNIAAAKARWQSLQIRCELLFLPGAAFYRTLHGSYCCAAGEAGIESADADEAEAISSTNRPSVADAATNWFPASRERNAEIALSAVGPVMCPQVFPASRERNNVPFAEDTTTAFRTGAKSSIRSSERFA